MADRLALSVAGVTEGEAQDGSGERGILLCIALVSTLEICAALAWLLW